MSKKSIEKEAEEQRKQDEKWNDYELPEGFVPNKALLFGFQAAYAIVPLICAIILMVLTIAPLSAGQSVTTFIADVISESTTYVIRGVVSLFIVLAVIIITLEAASRVAESLSINFAGVQKRAIREAFGCFLVAGVLPLVLCFVGKRFMIGGFQTSWAIPMAVTSFVYLIWIIVESSIKKDVKTEQGEEPSLLYKSFLSVYGEKVKSNHELLDTLGTPAHWAISENKEDAIYVFYGSEMACSVFSKIDNLALLPVANYAEEKGKVISVCIVEVKDSKVADIVFYEDITDISIDIDFSF